MTDAHDDARNFSPFTPFPSQRKRKKTRDHETTLLIAVERNCLATLLLGDTDSPAAATSGLGVLATNAEAPVVTETTVGTNLLETLQVVTELRVDTVGQSVEVLAVGDIALSVKEPGGDLVLGGVLDDGDDTLELFRGELTGAGRLS